MQYKIHRILGKIILIMGLLYFFQITNLLSQINELWITRYDDNSWDDVGNALVIDDLGNVYVTGYNTFSFYPKYVTIKYNSNGVQQWCSEYRRLVNNYNQSLDIDIDNARNVYVTGYSSYGPGSMYTGIATIKYNNDGVQQWVDSFEGIYSSGNAIIVDNLGDAYVTGYSGGEKASDMTTKNIIQMEYNNG